MDDLFERARAWSDEDPDPETRAEVRAALAADDRARIADWFGARLEFGTAGMRGELGPGPNRMNRALVRRVTDGLAAAIASDPGPVAIGCDGRRGSREFASDAASVLIGIGRDVYLYDRVCPTPELAHAVLHLGCAAGIMVTASHNPARDNGYKVYARNGAQIVPPLDGRISAEIDRVGPLVSIRLGDVARARSVPADCRAAYVRKVLALRVHPGGSAPKTVYTAMHGVGWELLREVLRAAGREVVAVPEQAEPDGAFPTVAFPNPEEKGALDLAVACAASEGAGLILANDPDADRLAVAVPVGAGWRQLTGNQVGCLLAEDLLAHGPTGRRMVATTVVSSRMLARIAAHHGVEYRETLTGFKWIANAALAFEAEGGRFVVGYEEALGYTAGDVVRDKDGISAALLLLDLAATGRSLLDRWTDLCRLHGLHHSAQISLAFRGADGRRKIAAINAGLRANPPTAIGAVAVVRTRDLSKGEGGLPPSDVLAYDLADGSSVLVRPSGTEPKVKLYFEVRVEMAAGETLEAAEGRAEASIERLKRDLTARVS
jgi:phosphomannomutase